MKWKSMRPTAYIRRVSFSSVILTTITVLVLQHGEAKREHKRKRECENARKRERNCALPPLLVFVAILKHDQAVFVPVK